uniref:Transposase IS116/IS110/IS902 family protein n=4 Tax=Candidatus Kentrum sp. MB TaxID=2138164 RepID=A0A450XND6_9GAMM|nr:MAG: Transposase IS116/IS110/IS902 family protein [Candidatus Kentron sp. MB]
MAGELTKEHVFVISEILIHIEDLERRIATLFRELVTKLEPYKPMLRAMETIPGIDRMAAAMLLVEFGNDMTALGTAEKLASWVGVCPGNHESAGKRVSGKKRKGNPYVRRTLCEIANSASRTRCAFQEKFKSLLVRRGRKRAIFALAHKILKIIFVLLSRGDYYRDAATNYEKLTVERNAPRWMKMLKKYGYITVAA